MGMFKKLFLAVLLFLFSLIPNPYTLKPVFAAEEFATSYDVVYDVGLDGVTTVTEKVTLKNLTSQYYANQFKLMIGATQISDIKGSDPGGALETSSELKDTSTTINVKFNQQVAGLGKELPWTLQFKSKDFAEKLGKVWAVHAPKVSSTANLENYNLTISVPTSFGEPTLISPTPKSQTTAGSRMFFTFEKDQLLESGVSASFGSIQLFDFDLSYHLQNDNLVPILTNIALPPDTSFQDVIFQRIEPKPLNVTVDTDGNYLAWYRLLRGQKIDIKVVGSAKLYTKSKVKNPIMEESVREKYTKDDKYWESNHPQIALTLAKILEPESIRDSSDKVRLIYKYVVNLLKYDSSRLEDSAIGGVDRLGAVTALNNPNSAVCMEFTDLFITLARAAGIPARELNGFAYTANTTLRPLSLTRDVLHAWPEYWDERRGWVMVDPTWENTTGGVDYFSKLDLNHFIFAIKGSSSSQPPPAGSYKIPGEDTRDVKVTLSDIDFLGKSQIDVKIESEEPILAGFPSRLKVKVINLGNAVYPSSSFDILAQNLTILDGKDQKLGPIPAFGEASFEFNIRTKSLFDTYDDQIRVLIGSLKFTKDVHIKPFIILQTIPLIFAGVVLGMGGIYLLVLGGLLYRRKILKISK
ncbi:transglutaminase domain-containing protein [Candidatus Daviesbacteria bacterium]|nr:transglutaminase domain-containing protein [Candidatus Daviesbacteria bacterium]